MSEAEVNNGHEEPEFEKYVENGKNKFVLRCPHCDSKILEKKSGQFVTLETDLPLAQCKMPESGEVPTETIKEFYHVENMFTFENIGFTYQVANRKYLSCADCHAGPLGYFDIGTSHSYLALSRVTHK